MDQLSRPAAPAKGADAELDAARARQAKAAIREQRRARKQRAAEDKGKA